MASFKVALLREINKFEFLMCCLDTCTPDPTLLDNMQCHALTFQCENVPPCIQATTSSLIL